MSAVKPIYEQIEEHRKIWKELWWRMAEGDINSYKEIKALDVMEFYSLFDQWRDDKNKQIERARAKAKRN